MTSAERIWPNSTVVCVAPGPSLTPADVDYVRGKARVIAINDAVLLCPWADVLYSSDRAWWEQFSKTKQAFGGLRYSVGSQPDKANPYARHPEIQVLTNTGETGLELQPTGLKTGRNSGYSAINLAVHFGAKQIVLLGYNMGRLDGRTHYCNVGYRPNSPYPQFRELFKTIVKPLRELGTEVINCTPDTCLDVFPITALREVVEEAVAA